MSGESGHQEIGWNPIFDEGIRLRATHANFSGLRARLQLPQVYACPTPEGYFNFYLGINFVRNAQEVGAVEAGISFSFKGGQHQWRYFVNPPGNPRPTEVAPGSVIVMELDVQDGIASLSVGSFDGISFSGHLITQGRANGKAGFVKMVSAIQEFRQDSAKREIWFDEIQFAALQVRKVDRTDWLDISRIEGLSWNLERPPSMHHLIHCRSSDYHSFTPWMGRRQVEKEMELAAR